MAQNYGVLRLQKEFKAIQSKMPENFIITPLPNNLYEWHYVIHGLKDCPYEGGYYYGKIIFPA